jgi:hypothetical protein
LLGGGDVSSIFAMFDGPRGGLDSLMIVDAKPFGAPREITTLARNQKLKNRYYEDMEHKTYADMDALNHEGAIGATILWELEKMSARNIKIEYLDAGGVAQAPHTADRTAQLRALLRSDVRGPMPEQVAADTDIVSISFTSHGRARHLYYVQHDVRDPHEPAVLARYLDAGIDAYVDKAPMGVLGRFGAGARNRALMALNRTHGVAISSDERLGPDMHRRPPVETKFGYARSANVFMRTAPAN